MNCNGKIVDFSIPKVMGILNITPNSFYDGGKFVTEKSILDQVEKMLVEGADFIDIGACSSKPNAEIISEKVEVARIASVMEMIIKRFSGTIFSIDTYRSEVARIGIENGASIINDISAGSLDMKMMETVAKYRVPYIMMHLRGNPQTMQNLTNYGNIIKEMLFYFSEKVAVARSFGIKDLVIDPGFGFAKTLEQNFEVLQKLELFEILDLPVLAGLSRKSMIYKTLGTNPEKALNGTTALNMLALYKGAKILRVHDVKEAVDCVKLNQLIMNNLKLSVIR
jgi:dihydropteroate synthase